jgi:predicted AAA+ superfamily ATPase
MDVWSDRNKIITKIEKKFFNKDVKIIIGARRVGKSFLLSKIKEEMLLKNLVTDENIFELNFNKKNILKKYTWDKLVNDELERCNSKENFALFIDEVQELKRQCRKFCVN